MKRRPLPTVREHVTNGDRLKAFYHNDWTVYGFVACLGILSYVNSLDGEFVHDDIPAIVTNGDVTGANGLRTIFNNDFWGTPMADANSHKSYRPLTTITFRLNFSICSLSTYGWHAVNVMLHAVCCALVTRVGIAVAHLQRPFATLAGILFAVHPVHTEAAGIAAAAGDIVLITRCYLLSALMDFPLLSIRQVEVSGVVGRADVLACIFFLTSLLLYHGSCSGNHYVWSSIMAAALGMLAKEIGVTVLMFNILFDMYLSWNTFNKSTWRYTPNGLPWRVACVLLSLLVLVSGRLAMLQGSMPAFSPQDNPPAFHPVFYVRLLTFSYLSSFNWWLLVCPMRLSHDWQMGSIPLVTSLYDARNLLTLAALLTMLALVWRVFNDFDSHRHTPIVVGLLLLVIPYLPASNILLTVGFVIAERVLYIPSVGAVLLTAAGMQLLWRRRCLVPLHKLLLMWMMITIVAYVNRTLHRNADWRTRETLLRADLSVLPHNAKLHYNFANFLKDIDQQDNAIKHYKEALRLWPSYASAHNNLGTLMVASGRAEHHFLQALKYNREHVNAHYNLGKLYRKKNRLLESQRMLERCITLEPRFTQAHIELLHMKTDEEKKIIIKKLIELEPHNWEHYILYGNWFKSKGLKQTSLHYYLEAMRHALQRWSSDRVSRGCLLSLRASCLLLRSKGQSARILQLMTRWQVVRSGCGPGSAKLLRSWQLRSELTGRAQLYDKQHHHAISSTCLHHSKLEIDQTTIPRLETQQPAHECQHKRSLSITALDKLSHNKSEIGEKASSKDDEHVQKLKEQPDINPYITDSLIKTY